MGVRGLQTYLLQRGNCLRRHRLHNCQLVIDATNLVHHLYSSAGTDYLYSGEYDLYARRVRRVLATLRECDVEAIFVFDGAKDWDGAKFSEQRRRMQQRIDKCRQLRRGRLAAGNCLLPLLAVQLFVDCVKQFEFALICVALGDADLRMAALAAELNCPVLTNDSDFMIFDLPAGVVLTKTANLHTVCSSSSSGVLYIDCELYRICQLLVPLRPPRPADPQLLPLCAALCGNDFLQRADVNERLLSRMQLPKQVAKGANQQHKRIAGLLVWTHRNFQQPEACLSAIARLLGDAPGSGQFLQRVRASLAQYHLLPGLALDSQRRRVLLTALPAAHPSTDTDDEVLECSEEDQEEEEEEEEEKEAADHVTTPPPDWLNSSHLELYKPTLLIDAAQFRRVFLPVGVENVAEASVFDASCDLRGAAYSLELRSAALEFGHAAVIEFGRRGTNVAKRRVNVDCSQAHSCHSLGQCLAERLGFGQDPLLGRSLPCIGQRLLLYAALRSVRDAALSTAREARAVALAFAVLTLHRFGEELEEGEDEEAKQERRRVLAKYFAAPSPGASFDLAVAHSVAALQALLFSAQLLERAHAGEDSDTQLPVLPSPGEYLAGRFVYNLACDAKARKSDVVFLAEILNRRSRHAVALGEFVALMSRG